MARLTKMKTRPKDGGHEILVLVNHPMETGQRVNPKTKQKVPAHFIQKLTIEVNGKPVAVADLGVAISKNPLVGVAVKGTKAGDKVKASWTDNKGESGKAETTI